MVETGRRGRETNGVVSRQSRGEGASEMSSGKKSRGALLCGARPCRQRLVVDYRGVTEGRGGGRAWDGAEARRRRAGSIGNRSGLGARGSAARTAGETPARGPISHRSGSRKKRANTFRGTDDPGNKQRGFFRREARAAIGRRGGAHLEKGGGDRRARVRLRGEPLPSPGGEGVSVMSPVEPSLVPVITRSGGRRQGRGWRQSRDQAGRWRDSRGAEMIQAGARRGNY